MAWPQGLIVVGVCGLFLAARPTAPTVTTRDVPTLLDQYEAGDYPRVMGPLTQLAEQDRQDSRDSFIIQFTEAGVAIGTDGKGPVFDALRKAAPAWIAAKGADAAPHRRMVVAAFALDLAYLHRDMPLNYKRVLVVWACDQLRTGVPPSDALRWWYIASVALFESQGDWLLIGGGADENPNDRFFTSELKAGHLAHALAIFPQDSHLRFAHAEYDEEETTNHLGESFAGPDDDEVSPAHLNTLKQLAAGKSDLAPGLKIVIRNTGRIDDVLAEYEGLQTEEALAPEVELHLGYLHERLEQWSEALDHLRLARATARDIFLRYLSALLEGWAFERLNQLPEAIEAYRDALAMAPHARTPSILLAATLTTTGHQAEAYRLLNDLWQRTNSTEEPDDPWTRYGLGQGRLTASFLATMRAALR